MDLTVEEFLENVFTKEAAETPSDSVKPPNVQELPPWFDEKKFNQARRFYWRHSFSATSSMLMGLISAFSLGLDVLIGTCRSSSVYTAYKRYNSTMQHTISWFKHELKPGSISWKSLQTVRARHYKATVATKMKGIGVIAQRDMALTQFSFMGYLMLYPERFGVRAMDPGDWEAYNHFWSVIGYMIGLQDRYNLCRKTVDETRAVCRFVHEYVFKPCMENPVEYFEYMARVTMDGTWYAFPGVKPQAMMYMAKYMADVPGYIFTEEERIDLERKLRKALKGKSIDDGVDVSELIETQPMIKERPGSKHKPSRKLYLNNYKVLDNIPHYRSLTWDVKLHLCLMRTVYYFYTFALVRWLLNLHFSIGIFLQEYLPYLAFFKFGIRNAYVDMFKESPTDKTKPIKNEEILKREEVTMRSKRFNFLKKFVNLLRMKKEVIYS